jgi:8-oxo-dGTP pyrophosphatase MutT (NUDIX family)
VKTKPGLPFSFELNSTRIFGEWYDLQPAEALPDIPWQQVYALADSQGKVAIVHYPEANHKDNLPGGHVEPGESAVQALHRELEEEINAKVLAWKPLGYQKLTEPDGSTVYQLRVYARVEPLGAFENDPGGNVIGHSFVPLDTLNEYIKYGEVGDILIRSATPLFES